MERRSKSKVYLLMFAVVLLVALGGAYYYIVKYSGMSLEEALEVTTARLTQQETSIQQSELDSKDAQIKLLKAQTNALKKEQNSVPVKLRYSIKPKQKVVAVCHSMKLGRWKVPKSCQDELINGIFDIAREDNKIVAFEVSGIVDNLPYAGSSPELKQEGLASFRAREAIWIVGKKMPNVAVFEGLSQQKAYQRGFVVRAFYVDN